jgi:predicted dehydrogenase
MTEKLIIIGWGRMGITHASIINGLYPDRFETVILEPNKIVRFITGKTFDYRVSKNLDDLDIEGNTVLITTPPSFHREIANRVLKRKAKSVFIEKPFGLYDKRVLDDARIAVGYVLRFTEVAQSLKALINEKGCKEISLSFNSNTLTKPPKGWRNSEHGGVLNEMGSHLIDLVTYLLGSSDLSIDTYKVESVISNVDDIVEVNGSIGESKVEVKLNWVNKQFRKPVWSGHVTTNGGQQIRFDQQSIDTGFALNTVDYYVRGREFSLQMKHFIERNNSIACTSIEANKVHDIITQIKRGI